MSDPARFVSETRLIAIICHLFETAGVPQGHAQLAARVLAVADLRGVSSHGMRLIGYNIHRLQHGGANPRPNIRPVTCFGALEALDGDFGMGMVCASVAMERAIAHAIESGIGCVTVRQSNHCAACGAYALMAVECGLIGIALSNTPPNMAIEGAADRAIGNNPLAIGAPGPDFPVVLDMAMSVASGGRMGTLRRAGKSIPSEWVIMSPDGKPVMRPFGGPKGSGLAVMVEILTGVLAGGAILSQQSPGRGFSATTADNCTQTAIAINLHALVSEDRYNVTIRQLVAELKAVARAPGIEEILLPGERAWQETLRRRAEGIPLEPDVVEMLESLAQELGTAVPWE